MSSAEQISDSDPLAEVELHGRPIRQWIDWLAKDGGRVPCSRYGNDSESCAYWSVACEYIYIDANGNDSEPAEALNYYQGLVVNDSSEVLELVRTYWYRIPPALKEYLDYYDSDCNMHQQAALSALCMRYGVEFVAEHYTPQFDLPDGYVAGFIGGFAIQKEHPTIFVGCSEDGHVSS